MPNYQLLLKRMFFLCCCLVCTIVFYLSQYPSLKVTPTVRPFSTQKLYPSNWTLVNLKHFEFLLNSDVCGTGKQSVELLVVVTSHPGHVELRHAFRSGLPAQVLRKFGIRRLFLLGRIDPAQKDYRQVDQSVIEQEHLTHQDLVQGSFVESYRHLSYKHMMGLKYAVHFCPHAKLVLKMDDDIAVDIFQLLDFVKQKKKLSGLRIAGAVMSGEELNPQRNRSASKWYVTPEEYPMGKYPRFVSGWAYVTTLEAARELVKRSEASPFFWIDDVYVTGMLADLSNIAKLDIRSRLTIYSDHFQCCLQNGDGATAKSCDYFILPAENADSLETFYRQILQCESLRPDGCPEGDVPASRCVIAHRLSGQRLMNGRVIHGQVIPLNWSSTTFYLYCYLNLKNRNKFKLKICNHNSKIVDNVVWVLRYHRKYLKASTERQQKKRIHWRLFDSLLNRLSRISLSLRFVTSNCTVAIGVVLWRYCQASTAWAICRG